MWLHEIEGPGMIAYDGDLMRGVDFIHTTSQHVWGLDLFASPGVGSVHLERVWMCGHFLGTQ